MSTSKGRPRRINDLGAQATKFLDLYLDPLNSVEQICALCGIKKSTFYNYEKELNLPHLRVGVGCVDAALPRKVALNSFHIPEERRELEIVRHLSRELQARIKIIPVISNDANSPTNLVRSKQVDFVISSLSKTRDRSKDLYFSENYLVGDFPHGVLIRNPAYAGVVPFTAAKPTLGVLANTVHSEFADANLQQDFFVRHIRSSQEAFRALQNGNLDFVLFHPLWLKLMPAETQGLEVCSKPYRYPTWTGVAFHSDSQMWTAPVNQGIESFLQKKL